MNTANSNKFLDEVLTIEAEEAMKAGAIGYMAQALVRATMPHRSTTDHVFTRTNGRFTLTLMANPKVGLPWGSIPRLVLAWVTTEAVKTSSRTLVLGGALSDFMDQLDLVPTGGRWGSIYRVRRGTTQLFSSVISLHEQGTGYAAGGTFTIADKYMLFWDQQSLQQPVLFNSTVQLSEVFFNEIVNYKVPIDLRALKALKQSPMALDIYCWLTYRMSYLADKAEIPWRALQTQFGAGYPMTPQGTSDFRKKFLLHLRKVQGVYRHARVGEGKQGLNLYPSPTHIPKLRNTK